MEVEETILGESSPLEIIQELRNLIVKKDASYLQLKKKIIATSSVIASYQNITTKCSNLSKENDSLKQQNINLEKNYQKSLLDFLKLEEDYEKFKTNHEKLKNNHNGLLEKIDAKNSTVKQLQNLAADLQSKIESREIESEMTSSNYKTEISKLKENICNMNKTHSTKSNALEKKISELYAHIIYFGGKNYSELSLKDKRLFRNLKSKATKITYPVKENVEEVMGGRRSSFEDILEELDDPQEPLSIASSKDTGLGSSVCSSDNEKCLSAATTPTRENCVSPRDLSLYSTINSRLKKYVCSATASLKINTDPVDIMSPYSDSYCKTKDNHVCVGTSPINMMPLENIFNKPKVFRDSATSPVNIKFPSNNSIEVSHFIYDNSMTPPSHKEFSITSKYSDLQQNTESLSTPTNSIDKCKSDEILDSEISDILKKMISVDKIITPIPWNEETENNSIKTSDEQSTIYTRTKRKPIKNVLELKKKKDSKLSKTKIRQIISIAKKVTNDEINKLFKGRDIMNATTQKKLDKNQSKSNTETENCRYFLRRSCSFNEKVTDYVTRKRASTINSTITRPLKKESLFSNKECSETKENKRDCKRKHSPPSASTVKLKGKLCEKKSVKRSTISPETLSIKNKVSSIISNDSNYDDFNNTRHCEINKFDHTVNTRKRASFLNSEQCNKNNVLSGNISPCKSISNSISPNKKLRTNRNRNMIDDDENKMNLEKAKVIMSQLNLHKNESTKPIRKKVMTKIKVTENKDMLSSDSKEKESTKCLQGTEGLIENDDKLTKRDSQQLNSNISETPVKNNEIVTKIQKASKLTFFAGDKIIENSESPPNLCTTIDQEKSHREIVAYNDVLFDDIEDDQNHTGDNLKSTDTIFESLIEKRAFKFIANKPYEIPSAVCDAVETYLSDEFSLDTLDNFIQKIITEKEQSIACAVVEFLCNPKRFDEPYLSNFPMLPMSPSHQSLMCFVNRIHSSPPAHFKNNFIELIMKGIEFRVFTLNKTPCIDSLKSLGKFYTVLCRIIKSKDKLKLFCMDAIYCMSYKAVPLIYNVLQSWPSLFPPSNCSAAEDPLVIVIIHSLLSNFSEDWKYNPRDMQMFLLKKYGYKTGEFTDDDILKLLIQKTRGVKSDSEKNVTAAFLLFAKRCGIDWCYKNIILNSLIPMIHDDSATVKAKATAIKLIGPLVRPFPPTMTLQCEMISMKLIKLLDTTTIHELNEAIVSSLTYFSKKNFKNIVQVLIKWRPQQPISAETMTLLESVVNDRTYLYWKKFQIKNIHS